MNRKDTNFRQPIIKTASSTAGRLRSGILSGAAAIGLAYAALLGSSPASAQQQQRPDKPLYLSVKPDLTLALGDDVVAPDRAAGRFRLTRNWS